MKKQITIRALVGFGFGLGFAMLQFIVLETASRTFHDHTAQPMRSILQAYSVMDAPAEWLSNIWTNVLWLPPHSELAWVLVPIVMVSIQWSLIGFLAGLCWGIKAALSANAENKRMWPVVWKGGGVLVGCGLLVLLFGIISTRLMEPDEPKFFPEQNELENIIGPQLTQEEIDILDTIDVPSNDAEVCYRRGVMLANRNMASTAAIQFRDALEINPNYAEAHYHLGLALVSYKKDVDEAITHFRKALEIKPNYAEANYQIGLALAKKKKFADAVTYYRKALAIKPNFVEVQKHLDDAIKMMNR